MEWILGVLVVVLLAGVAALFYWLRRRSPLELVDPGSLIVADVSDLDGRVLTIEGVANFRDIGGYVTADGREVRRGLVYRSGKLDAITPAGWQQMQALGLRMVCDMRTEEEIADAPDNLPDKTITRIYTPLHTDDDRAARLRALLFDRNRLRTILPELYTTIIVDQNAAVMGQVIGQLAEPENLPILIHCTAGKDRTGVAVGLLLALLGVPDETIIADYTLSNLYYDNFYAVTERLIRRFVLFGLTAAHMQPLLVAEAETLRFTLDYVRQRYGSIPDYLEHQAGLSADTLDRVRANLLS
ncbi:MAG: tyrosine-protein phosphatase [Chloroflexota bacterium]